MAMFSSTLDMNKLAEADANLTKMGVTPGLVKTIKEHDFDPDALMAEANSLIDAKDQLQEAASSWDGSIGEPNQWEGSAHDAAVNYHECAFQWLEEVLNALTTAISWLLYVLEMLFYLIRWLASWVFWLAGWISAIAFFASFIPAAQVVTGPVLAFFGAAAAIAAAVAAVAWLLEAILSWLRESLTRSQSSVCGRLSQTPSIPLPPEGPIREKKPLPSPPTWPFA